MSDELKAFVEKAREYEGPARRDVAGAVVTAKNPIMAAFDLGYRQGYADCAAYVDEALEEESL